MRTPWIRNRPGPEENRRAAGLALAVAGALGAVIFYFARILLARDRIGPVGEGRARELGSGEGEAE